jgi:hypothetical protein
MRSWFAPIARRRMPECDRRRWRRANPERKGRKNTLSRGKQNENHKHTGMQMKIRNEKQAFKPNQKQNTTVYHASNAIQNKLPIKTKVFQSSATLSNHFKRHKHQTHSKYPSALHTLACREYG